MNAPSNTTATAVPTTRAKSEPAEQSLFKAALAEADRTLAAHNAACTAYSRIEQRVFAEELPEEDPTYLAAQEAEAEASQADAKAWAVLMETPAETVDDLHAKIAAYGQIVGGRDASAPVFPNEVQLDEHAALARIIADSRRLGRRAQPGAITTSLPFEQMEAEMDALFLLASNRNSHGDDDPDFAAARRIWRQIVDAPITSNVDAAVKVRWLAKEFEDGESNDGPILKDQLIAYLTSPNGPHLRAIEANRPTWENRKAAFEAAKAAAAAAPDDDDEEAFNCAADALEALDATPAPDINALLYQIREDLEFCRMDWVGQHPDDPATIAHMLAKGGEQADLARIYQQVHRLAGVDSPILYVEPKLHPRSQQHRDTGSFEPENDAAAGGR